MGQKEKKRMGLKQTSNERAARALVSSPPPIFSPSRWAGDVVRLEPGYSVNGKAL